MSASTLLMTVSRSRPYLGDCQSLFIMTSVGASRRDRSNGI